MRTDSRLPIQLHKSGDFSQSSFPLYFDLESSGTVDAITVEWPSGKIQTLKGPIENPTG